jgi:hypothetical protein
VRDADQNRTSQEVCIALGQRALGCPKGCSTVGWLAKQILARFEKFGEIFVTQRSGVTLYHLQLVSCAAEMISDGEGKGVLKCTAARF